MTALALTFVAQYGPNLPVADDFDVIDVAAGGRRCTLEWLWSLHNEHRVLLPRLILLSLYRLSEVDFRVGMFFSVAALAALAAASIVIAARRPGAAGLMMCCSRCCCSIRLTPPTCSGAGR